MFKKIVKKIALAATLVCMATTVAAATACNVETKHPKVRITVEFNSQEFELDYTLYRNMYPSTVRHFIELAENGIYDNMLIHDYRTSDWLSGGFKYNAQEYAAAAEINAYADYLEEHSLEGSYMELFEAGKLTPTVYSGSEYDDNGNLILVKDSALPTLVGEFYNNIKQTINKGALTAVQGTLKMYYYAKETTNKVHVTPSDEIIWNADYNTNCATSVFAMQVGSSSAISASDYCVFGKMDSVTKLIDLIDAVKDYYNDDEEAVSITVTDVNVDNLVEVFSSEAADKGIEVDFTLPALPIVIKTVKVTKY